MPPAILERIVKTDKLPSLPTIALKVLELTRSENVSIAKLAALIQNDPALTASILKMVNSPFFGLTRKITSINYAMTVLGLRTVTVLVLSFSVVSVVPGNDKFDYQGYWRRSLTMATAARSLAQAARSPFVDEAFVGGLLSDIGMIAAWRCAPELYQPVLEAWAPRNRALVDIEMEKLGVTHAAMSRALLKKWSLPENLCEIVGSHHGEGLDQLPDDTAALGKIIYSAAIIAGLFCKDIAFTELDTLKAQCREMTGIGDAELESTLDALDSHVRDTATTLAVQVGETLNYAQLQMDAAAQLAQISMQTEMERAASSRREEEARLEVDAAKIRVTTLETHVTALEDKAKKSEILEQSVKVASERQRRLLPSKPPEIKGVRVGIVYRPAEHISGDFYDFVMLPEGKVGFIIGDVSGHGIEAGMLMGISKKILSEQLARFGDPIKAISSANDDLCKSLDQESFVTALIAVYDPTQRSFTVASAGHDAPLVYRPAEDVFVELDCAGPILGVTEGMDFEAGSPLFVTSGDVIVFMTDGLFECMNAQNESFGKDRIRELMKKNASGKTNDILAAILRAVSAWTGENPLKDDVTAIVVKCHSAEDRS